MNALLEKLNVNWSVFSDEEARVVQRGIENGAYDQLVNMLVSVNPEKADEIAKIQAQLRPKTFVFNSAVQKEFEIWMKNNPGAITPEIEAEWQAKIDKERNEALARMQGESPLAEIKAPNEPKAHGSEAKEPQMPDAIKEPQETAPAEPTPAIAKENSLDAVPGLAQESIEKLNASNIFTIDDLKKYDDDELRMILNPVVAASIKKFLANKA